MKRTNRREWGRAILGGGATAKPREDRYPLLTDADVDKWTSELRRPLDAVVRDIPSDLRPPVGGVSEGVAPEWHWHYAGDDSNTAKGEHGVDAERKAHIYRAEGAVPRLVHLIGRDFLTEIVPGFLTRRLGYADAQGGGDADAGGRASAPGPTIRATLGHPLLVRVTNRISERLHLEMSVHLHGGHTPAHADGHPNFLIPSGESRDYYYPNPVPRDVVYAGGVPRVADGWDTAEAQSTMWYHDHAEDITAHNALMGMAGFYLLRDATEASWVATGALPDGECDIPIAIQDLALSPILDPDRMDPEIAAEFRSRRERNPAEPILGEARIVFDPFDHDGTLGNLVALNGTLFPRLTAKRARYRLRLLNASNARFYNLEFWRVKRLLDPAGEPRVTFRRVRFQQIGRDSWLLPEPLEQDSVFLGMANRADVVLDFDALELEDGEELYLVNTCRQDDGRGPGHGGNEREIYPQDELAPQLRAQGPRGTQFEVPRLEDGVGFLMKIELAGEPQAAPAPIPARLRDFHPTPLERGTDNKLVYRVREFDFERGQGAWKISGRFYDPTNANAVPELWSTELWILRNRSGGWWHPIHIHLESHQQVYAEARNHRGDRIVVRREDYDPEALERLRAGALRGEFEVHEFRHDPASLNLAGFADAVRDGRLPEGFDRTVWNVGIRHDTTLLGPNTEVHILLRCRTFQGPFVFHCHNLNHEDMRMMFQFDPRAGRSAASNLRVRPDHWFFHAAPPE